MLRKITALLCAALTLNASAAQASVCPVSEVCVYDTALSEGGFFEYINCYADSSESGAAIKWQTKINKSILSGFPNCAAYDGYIYTAADSRVYKLDRSTGNIVRSAALDASIGYSYYITAADGKVFVQLKNGAVQAFSAASLMPLWISQTPVGGKNAQGLSPMLYEDGYIYTGSVVMSKTLGKGSFYRINTADAAGYETKAFDWEFVPEDNSAQSSGFYWTGAAAVGERIVFGSEGGVLYMADKASGEILDKLAVDGNIRSTAVYEDGRVYITAQNGRLYSIAADENGFGDVRFIQFCTNSSCRAVIQDGNIYVGGSGTGASSGVFCVIDKETLKILHTFDTSGRVQGSPYAEKKNGSVYVYFNCNQTPGSMMYIDDKMQLHEFFTPSGENAQYCVNAVNTDSDGTIYYQNDSGFIAALVPAVHCESVSETSSEETTAETTAAQTEETTAAKTSSGGGGGSGSHNENITVFFEVRGDEPHGEYGHENYNTWLKGAEYKVKKGSSAEKLVTRVLEENGFAYVLENNGYISSVTNAEGVTLAEFTNGANSGWMYTVNGEFPQTALNGYMLNDGDILVFMYSDDYTVSDKRYSSGGDAQTSTVTESTSETTTEEKQLPELPQDVSELEFFEDVGINAWYFYPVECLHALGAVNGRDGNVFCPDDTVTRAEFAAMLYRLFGREGVPAAFEDVPREAWYAKAVGWAYENGVVYGTDERHFSPFAPITRQDAAAMLYRLSRADKSGTRAVQYSDKEDISPYARPAAAFMTKAGVISGMGDNTFAPKKNTTRAEAAVMVFKFIEFELGI